MTGSGTGAILVALSAICKLDFIVIEKLFYLVFVYIVEKYTFFPFM